MGDWEQVAKLGDQGIPLKKKFTKETATELLTFIEGYAHVGQWEKALEWSSIVFQETDKSQSILCQTWGRILESTDSSEERKATVAQLEEMLKCDLP
jgi:hypothetical protein